MGLKSINLKEKSVNLCQVVERDMFVSNVVAVESDILNGEDWIARIFLVLLSFS